MTTFIAIAAMVAVLTSGMPNARAASDSPPIIQVEPGLDARCVAQVNVDSVRLVRAVPQWWSRHFQWEGIRFSCHGRAQDGSTPFTWDVPGLGIAGRGAIRQAGAGSVRWDWHLTAEEEWPVEGEAGARQPHGGLTFFLDLKAAARRGCTAHPELKAGKTGFIWEITPGKTVAVSFSTPRRGRNLTSRMK